MCRPCVLAYRKRVRISNRITNYSNCFLSLISQSLSVDIFAWIAMRNSSFVCVLIWWCDFNSFIRHSPNDEEVILFDKQPNFTFQQFLVILWNCKNYNLIWIFSTIIVDKQQQQHHKKDTFHSLCLTFMVLLLESTWFVQLVRFILHCIFETKLYSDSVLACFEWLMICTCYF